MKSKPKRCRTAGGSPQDFGFPPDFSFVLRPPPFDEVPREVLDKAITDRSDEARRDLAASIETFDRLVVTVPPLQALADFALYGLMARPGYDPETDSEDGAHQRGRDAQRLHAGHARLARTAVDRVGKELFTIVHSEPEAQDHVLPER